MSTAPSAPGESELGGGRTRVLIVGAGPVGLINARTLLEDGVFDVTMVAKEDRIGGNWAYTYPDLKTNNPWGALTVSGLDMPKPKNLPGHSIPAETYRRYLEDFFRYFIEGKARVQFQTSVVELHPTDEGSGWLATLRGAEGKHTEEAFDKVVLATGTLGKPEIPSLLHGASMPVFHTSQLAHPPSWDKLLALAPVVDGADCDGKEGTICVVGGGKSATDIAASLATRRRKVVIVMRGAKWHLPLVEHPLTPLSMMEVMFGPPLVIDNWAMWFYHCTALGAGIVKKFWDGMLSITKSVLYDERVPAPSEELFTSLPYFSGGIGIGPNDFRELVNEGKIEVIRGEVTGVGGSGVLVKRREEGAERQTEVRCKAVVVGTGWSGGLWDFLDPKLQYSLGLTPRPQAQGFERRVLDLRRKWKSVGGEGTRDVPMPLVYRGVLPVGRWREKDLVVAGATRPFLLPATVYGVESHWIASLFNPNSSRHPRLPTTFEEVERRCHEQNEYLLARYTTLDPSKPTIYSTFFTGFSDPAHTRLLLNDIGVYPWRQAGKKWWDWWSWFITPFKAEQYAGIGEERRRQRD